MNFRGLLLLVLILVATLCSCLGQEIKNWGYWLTDIDPEIVHDSEYDLMVIDYSRTGSDAFTEDEVSYMKERVNDEDRLLISYFSIGEAEEYRYYWNDEWKQEVPLWMDEENPDWPGNYKVKYWEPSWQEILFGRSDSYLDLIIQAGFDGVYLDIVDAFEYFESSRPTAEEEMVQLISSIASYSRGFNPDFKVIIQNGERILESNELLSIIDGVAKEDLYFGLEADNIRADVEETEFSLEYLQKAKNEGKLVLLASYVPHEAGKNLVIEQAKKNDFVPYFSSRDLAYLMSPKGEIVEWKKSNVHSQDLQRTPGDFFLQTLHTGQFKTSLASLTYDEKSVYSEADENGTIYFSQNVQYTDRQFPIWLEYGINEHVEVGVRIPIVHTRLSLDEQIGGDNKTVDSQLGLGNIALTANVFLPIDEENDFFSLLSMEYGIPTDTKEGFLKSSSFAVLLYNMEKVWGHFGLAGGVGLSNFNLSESLDNTQFVHRSGVLGIFSDRVFADAFYTRRGDRSFVEFSAEYLLSRKSSIDFYFAHDLMQELEIVNYAVTFTFFH